MKADLIENPSFFEEASYSWRENSKWLFNTISEKSKQTFFYLQEIGYFDSYYPYSTKRKNLMSYYICYTIEGSGVLEYEGKKMACEKGSCFFIDCTKLHHYYTAENKDWEVYWIHFNGLQAKGYYELFAENETYIIDVKDRSVIETIFSRLLQIYDTRTRTTEIMGSNLIVDLVTALILQKSGNLNSQAVLPDFVTDILKYLKENFSGEVTLDILAKLTYRSKFYISTEFKKYIGTTINQYLINLRIQKAKEYLRTTRNSVAEISYMVGINNPSHFIKLFKKNEGVTPKTLRNDWNML